MAYHYRFTKTSLKQLSKLPPDIQQRLINKLDYYCGQADPLIYAHKLSDFESGEYRFRVGKYRIIFDQIEPNTLIILSVGHRRDIYR